MTSRERYLWKLYGITQAQYEELLSQHVGCWICGYVPRQGYRRLSVDHDHKTGLIRGLLCYRCNKGIGVFRDDPQRLRNAASYVASNWSTHQWCVPEAYKHGMQRRRRKRKV